MLAFNNIRGKHASAVFTAYWFTQKKAYTNTTQAGVPSVLLAGPDDFILAGGATIVTATSVADSDDEGMSDPPPAAGYELSEYDPATGNHFGHGRGLGRNHGHNHGHNHVGDYSSGPVTDRARLAAAGAAGAILNIRTGEPGQRTEAIMAHPFKGEGKIVAISFEYQWVVGFGAPVPNATGASVALSYMYAVKLMN